MNITKEQFKKFEPSEHYLQRYLRFMNSILKSRPNRKTKFETELHHILPKSLFPEYSNLKKNSWNKIHLTYREHFIAHWLLYKSIKHPKTTFAFWAMHHQQSSTRDTLRSTPSVVYSTLREQAAKFQSSERKGVKLSDDVRKRMKDQRNTVESRILNSWNQLCINPMYQKYKSYEEFISAVEEIYVECRKNPTTIALRLGVTIDGVITCLTIQGKDYVFNQKETKLLKNYGDKFKSYEDYSEQIIALHNEGHYVESIRKTLGVNEYGVRVVLRNNNLVPHKGKTGPTRHTPTAIRSI